MAGDVNEAFPEQTVCQTDVAARVVRVAHLGLVVEMAMRVLADADRTAVMARMEQMAYPSNLGAWSRSRGHYRRPGQHRRPQWRRW